MPTYEYRCPKGHEFELFQKMSDKPRAKCPTCNANAERRISGGAGLHFKGSGFYITDYGKDGKGPRKSSEGGESAASAAPAPKASEGSAPKAETPKTEAKPAKKKGAE
jgi:putative FmdB family regulatory protein